MNIEICSIPHTLLFERKEENNLFDSEIERMHSQGFILSFFLII